MTVGFNHLGQLGQLGNQMFQYAITKSVASKLNVPFKIPNHQNIFDDGIGNRYTILLFNIFKLESLTDLVKKYEKAASIIIKFMKKYTSNR